MREKIQQLGGFLAGMVIPNIGAFIAWGLITALFIPTGWVPNCTCQGGCSSELNWETVVTTHQVPQEQLR